MQGLSFYIIIMDDPTAWLAHKLILVLLSKYTDEKEVRDRLYAIYFMHY
jgi:hypothetical protein